MTGKFDQKKSIRADHFPVIGAGNLHKTSTTPTGAIPMHRKIDDGAATTLAIRIPRREARGRHRPGRWVGQRPVTDFVRLAGLTRRLTPNRHVRPEPS